MEDTLTILTKYNLQDQDITPLAFKNKEDWLELRKKGIGGSDVGAVMGLNKYRSPLQVYKDKVEDIAPDLSDNVFVKKGKDLEAVIRENYVRNELTKIGYELCVVPYCLINNKYPWIRANLDGLAVPAYDSHKQNNIVIEIKWVNPNAVINWNKDEYCGVPASYYAQVQTYMLVTGANEAIVCALFDNDWKVHYYKVPRDETFISQLITTTRNFYTYNMQMGIAPKVDTELDRDEIVKKVKESVETLPLCYEEPLLDELVGEYKENEATLKMLTTKKKKLTDDITNLYLEGARPKNNALTVKVTTFPMSKLDTKSLKTDYPELYEKYVKQTDTARITIK